MKAKNIKKTYIVGIEGAGTSALAQLYKNLGYEVSGSDNGDHFYWRVLKNTGIKVFQNFDKANVPQDIDFAVHSSAFRDDNPEIIEIKKRGVKLLNYSQALGEFFQEKLGIAVCGTHGKTTTTAMLAEALNAAGLDPGALVGSNVIGWNSNVMLGKGEYFVAEADEYQNKLQYYNPWSAILTSVDFDHPDFFPDFAGYKNVFKEFVAKIPKPVFIVWGDSSDTLEVAANANCRILTYGFSDDCDYKIIKQETSDTKQQESQSFEVFYKEKSLGIFETPLVGKHNVLNSGSVIALCHQMQLDLEKIKSALQNFKGTTRRFEKTGMFQNAVLIDDYAHHPDEIKATLQGARQLFGNKRIWTVFHPHTFTRTKALLSEFAQSFDDADKSIVIDIYGSAREQQGGVSSDELVGLINTYNRNKAEYIPTIEAATEYLKEKSGQYDVLITMGAGDVWKIGEKLKNSSC